MSALTVTIRPNGARTEVRGLPFTGRGGGYAILGSAIGASRRGQVRWDPTRSCFSVARTHTGLLISSLAERYGQVQVIQYGGLARCVSACWSADPETAWDCECSCAGDNHGSRRPIGRVVADVGGAGELAVAPLAPREWTYRPG